MNPNLASGEIEVLAKDIEMLNASLTPPFQLDDENLSENVRLEYRVIDLRRPEMQRNLRLRYRVAMARAPLPRCAGLHRRRDARCSPSPRQRVRATILVPSRMHAGQFYALPQSPQLFKQLLMIAGFDRYYQITKCFRDEDLRADRQPEFTQIDVETSFLGVAEITGTDGDDDPLGVQGGHGRRVAEPVSAHELCRGDVQVRVGQARPARAA